MTDRLYQSSLANGLRTRASRPCRRASACRVLWQRRPSPCRWLRGGVDFEADEAAFAGGDGLDLAPGGFGFIVAVGEVGLKFGGLGLKFLRLLHHFHYVHGNGFGGMVGLVICRQA